MDPDNLKLEYKFPLAESLTIVDSISQLEFSSSQYGAYALSFTPGVVEASLETDEKGFFKYDS